MTFASLSAKNDQILFEDNSIFEQSTGINSILAVAYQSAK